MVKLTVQCYIRQYDWFLTAIIHACIEGRRVQPFQDVLNLRVVPPATRNEWKWLRTTLSTKSGI